MGISEQNVRDFNATQKTPKIPDYAKYFKNEFLFLRGIDKEFKYFHECVYFYDAVTGSFARKSKSIDRLNNIINKYKKGLEFGEIKDLSKQEIGNEVFYNIEYLEEMISELLERYLDFDLEGNAKLNKKKYEDNVKRDYPGLKKMIDTLSYYYEVIKYKKFYKNNVYDEPLINFTDDEEDSDYDDSDDSVSDWEKELYRELEEK